MSDAECSFIIRDVSGSTNISRNKMTEQSEFVPGLDVKLSTAPDCIIVLLE